jgi:hypothetical protein
MLAVRSPPAGTWEWFALAFGLHFHIADSRLQFQQLQLLSRELFAVSPVLLNALPAQALFQHLDLQFRQLQLVSQLFNEG